MVETLSDIGNKEVKYDYTSSFPNVSAGGDTGLVELVPGVTGKRIVVVNLRFSGFSVSEFIGGDQTSQVQFFSDSTEITGKWQATFDWWMDCGYNPDGHFQTDKGEALNYKLINTTAGTITCGVEVFLSYIEK